MNNPFDIFKDPLTLQILKTTYKLHPVHIMEEGEEFNDTSVVREVETPLGVMLVGVDLQGSINPEKEIIRIEQARKKANAELDKVKAKLTSTFLEKAPPNIIEEAKFNIASLEKILSSLKEDEERLERIKEKQAK